MAAEDQKLRKLAEDCEKAAASATLTRRQLEKGGDAEVQEAKIFEGKAHAFRQVVARIRLESLFEADSGEEWRA